MPRMEVNHRRRAPPRIVNGIPGPTDWHRRSLRLCKILHYISLVLVVLGIVALIRLVLLFITFLTNPNKTESLLKNSAFWNRLGVVASVFSCVWIINYFTSFYLEKIGRAMNMRKQESSTKRLSQLVTGILLGTSWCACWILQS